MIVTAIYTIGLLSALYESLLAPDRFGETIMASGLINGLATFYWLFLLTQDIYTCRKCYKWER